MSSDDGLCDECGSELDEEVIDNLDLFEPPYLCEDCAE